MQKSGVGVEVDEEVSRKFVFYPARAGAKPWSVRLSPVAPSSPLSRFVPRASSVRSHFFPPTSRQFPRLQQQNFIITASSS